MTNQDIVTNWQSLGVLLNGETEPEKLVEHFQSCWVGDNEPVELSDGRKVHIVVLDSGGEEVLWVHSDDKDNCWEVYADPDGKIQEKLSGKFVKV